MTKITTPPLSLETIQSLRVGMRVLLSGTIYTARDAAHQRLTAAIEQNQPLPFDLSSQVIYYVGPSPAQPGQVIGAAGPTTAGRVDPFTPLLLQHGLKGMIGKGKRSPAVRQAIQTYQAVYFVAVGGAAALLADCIKSVQIIAYDDLGTEAIRALTIENMPLVVANDIYGDDLFEQGQITYQQGTTHEGD
jgi:fumarate hydratase subunit beta